MYTIRVARAEEADAVQRFLRDEWREDHILVKDTQLFRHEFIDGDALGFVIALDEEEGRIMALLGFMKLSQLPEPDIYTSIWKVSARARQPMVGIELFQFIRKRIPHRHLFAPGPNERVLALYRHMKMQTGNLDHYYILNPGITDFSIARAAPRAETTPVRAGGPTALEPIEDADALRAVYRSDETLLARRPYKDAAFLIRRYFDYPVFRYRTYRVAPGNGTPALLMTREVRSQGAKALRIVDFVGREEALAGIRGDLHRLLESGGYEYVDFIQHGVAAPILREAGFTKLDLDSPEVVIPQYFSPFIRKNVPIRFFADVRAGEHHYVFKADGDQDRPVWGHPQ